MSVVLCAYNLFVMTQLIATHNRSQPKHHANPVEIRFLSTNVTPEVGANDGLVAVRVIPAGRDGTKVYGRTLKPGEVDPGVQ